MPNYTAHLAVGITTAKQLGIEDLNSYLVGSLIPDICASKEDKGKIAGHFATKPNFIRKSDTTVLLSKYPNLLVTDLSLGLYNHIYVDQYFYTEYFGEIFIINGDYIICKRTGKRYHYLKEFSTPSGIYGDYDGINEFLIRDYDIHLSSIDFNLSELPDIEEYDYTRLRSAKSELKKRTSISNEDYKGEFLKYDDVKKYIDYISYKFVKHVRQDLQLPI